MAGTAQPGNPKVLMEEAKKGNREAFGELYTLYFTPVFRYIFIRVRDHGEAENIAQDVFTKVYTSIDAYRDKGISPLAYFFTVARNTVIDFWQKKREIVLDPAEFERRAGASDENPARTAEQNEVLRIIRRALEELTDDQQEIIIMKFINGFSNKEIAVLTEKNENAIRQLQHRALIALREYFTEEK